MGLDDLSRAAEDLPDDAQEALITIDRLLSGDTGVDYQWASQTLLGIRETIEQSQRVSNAQWRALRNIEEGGQRGPRGGRRRYEGWGGGR